MIEVERPRSPEQRHEGGTAGREAGIQHPGRTVLPGAMRGWVWLVLPEDLVRWARDRMWS